MAFAGRSNKIFKEGGAKPDAFEEHVASAIFDLQVQTDMKADLQDLFITSASEVDVGSRKAIIIHVPFRLLNQFHRIQQRLIRELEKKFSGKHVTTIAQRRILPREVSIPPALAPPALPSTPLRLSRTHARAHTPSLPLHPSLVLAQQGDVVPLVYGDVTFVYDRVTCIYVSFAGTACDTYTGSVSFDGVV